MIRLSFEVFGFTRKSLLSKCLVGILTTKSVNGVNTSQHRRLCASLVESIFISPTTLADHIAMVAGIVLCFLVISEFFFGSTVIAEE